jgi:hypothetical protein
VIADYDVEFLLCDLGERVMAIFGYNDFSMWRLQCVAMDSPMAGSSSTARIWSFFFMRELAHYASRFSA